MEHKGLRYINIADYVKIVVHAYAMTRIMLYEHEQSLSNSEQNINKAYENNNV